MNREDEFDRYVSTLEEAKDDPSCDGVPSY